MLKIQYPFSQHVIRSCLSLPFWISDCFVPVKKRKKSTESTDGSDEQEAPSASDITIREQQPSSSARPTEAHQGNPDDSDESLDTDLGWSKRQSQINLQASCMHVLTDEGRAQIRSQHLAEPQLLIAQIIKYVGLDGEEMAYQW